MGVTRPCAAAPSFISTSVGDLFTGPYPNPNPKRDPDHRRKLKAVIGSIMRLTPLRGGAGSLPALVAGIPTAPLAHTIHSTSRAVPPAVVSVVGACSAARECGCTAASRRRSSARSCGSRH